MVKGSSTGVPLLSQKRVMLAPDFGCEFLFGIKGMHSDAALLNAIRSSHLFVASGGGQDISWVERASLTGNGSPSSAPSE